MVESNIIGRFAFLNAIRGISGGIQPTVNKRVVGNNHDFKWGF